MEINRDSVHGKLPLGSRVAVTEHSELAPVPIPGRTWALTMRRMAGR